jgi:hypothetical protein
VLQLKNGLTNIKTNTVEEGFIMKKYLLLLGLCFCLCNAAEFALQQQLLRAQIVMLALEDNPVRWTEEQKPKHSAKPLTKPNQKKATQQKQQNKMRIHQPGQRGRKR